MSSALVDMLGMLGNLGICSKEHFVVIMIEFRVYRIGRLLFFQTACCAEAHRMHDSVKPCSELYISLRTWDQFSACYAIITLINSVHWLDRSLSSICIMGQSSTSCYNMYLFSVKFTIRLPLFFDIVFLQQISPDSAIRAAAVPPLPAISLAIHKRRLFCHHDV